MNNKKGDIQIFILALMVIFMCIILLIMFLLYIQINSCIYNVKSDLFYVAQNAYIAANNNELAYSNYQIDQEMLQSKIVQLLKLNHPTYNLTANEIKFDYQNKCVYIDINMLLEPIVLKRFIKNFNVNLKDNIKLKLMEVK